VSASKRNPENRTHPQVGIPLVLRPKPLLKANAGVAVKPWKGRQMKRKEAQRMEKGIHEMQKAVPMTERTVWTKEETVRMFEDNEEAERLTRHTAGLVEEYNKDERNPPQKQLMKAKEDASLELKRNEEFMQAIERKANIQYHSERLAMGGNRRGRNQRGGGSLTPAAAPGTLQRTQNATLNLPQDFL
jgi:hypothetical protein